MSTRGMGVAVTDLNYAWVEGPAAPTVQVTPTLPGGSDPGSSINLTAFLTAAGVAAGVIGALLVLLGLLAILINRGKSAGKPTPKPTGPKKPDPEPPQVSYSLSASAGPVDVYIGEPASVTFTAMRIPSEGAPSLAVEATIQIVVSDSVAGLVASPTSGSGRLVCTFSAPNPKVCASLDVLAVAVVGGEVKARAYVRVRILPVYELEFKWDNPQQPALQVDGKEALAWAKVVSKPPDPDTPADVLAQQVNVSLQGPNSEWIRQPLAPYIEFEKQWNAISAVRPSVSAEMAPGNPVLVAEFSSARQQLKAHLSVELNQEIVLSAWVKGKKEADVIYQRKEATPGWDFAEIRTWFHAPDNEEKTIQPPFNTGDGPTIEANPPILDVKDHFELEGERGRYVIVVALKDGTDLETCFGETPVDQRKVEVKVFSTDEKGKEYHDFVTYRVRPTVTFCVHAYEDDPSNRVLQHEYRDIEFNQEMSLVANADDTLKMAGYFMRTDQLAKTGPDPEERLDIGEVNGFAWLNPQDETDLGKPQIDDMNTKDGFLCFTAEIQPAAAGHTRPPGYAAYPDLQAGNALRRGLRLHTGIRRAGAGN